MMECGNRNRETLRHEGKRETLKAAYTLGRETLKAAYTRGRERLRQAGVPEADLDAWYLLEYVMGISRASYLMEPDREMTGQQSLRYEECISKRGQRVPLQHITGEQEFMGLTFRVDENVLIPRQDTEILVEQALEILKKGQLPRSGGGKLHILDLCTGSGCILLSVLHYADKCDTGRYNAGQCDPGMHDPEKHDAEDPADMPGNIEGTGADISEKALSIAGQNADALGIRAEFIRGDLFENIRGKYGMILSNPPYIRSAEIDALQEEVRLHDPREALDGREDGLYFYRRITDEAREHLLPGGWLIFEIGYDQAEDVSGLMRSAGYAEVRVKKDLAGLDRVVYGRYS